MTDSVIDCSFPQSSKSTELPCKPDDTTLVRLNAEPLVTEFKRDQLERDAQKNWDKFYNRNADRFFKDRHWTQRELAELCPDLFGACDPSSKVSGAYNYIHQRLC